MKSVTVAVYDSDGLNFVIKGVNAVEIVKSILHGLRVNYVLVDFRHASIEQCVDYETEKLEDFAFYLDR